MTPAELQERLINFAVLIIDLTGSVNKSPAGIAMVNQIVRSSTSPALNYGEAVGAESTKDFIHKIQIVLKELRETWVNLSIIQKANLSSEPDKLIASIDECNQLISIFVKSITTSKKRL